jgi:ABC-type sulfate transport system substrate-binding protein
VVSTISSQFGLTLPVLWYSSYQSEHIFNQMYLLAKRNLVEKDLYSFQTEAYKINAKLYKFVDDRIKEARVDHATADFLKETLSVLLNWNNPVVLCLNSLIDKSTDFLMKY